MKRLTRQQTASGTVISVFSNQNAGADWMVARVVNLNGEVIHTGKPKYIRYTMKKRYGVKVPKV